MKIQTSALISNMAGSLGGSSIRRSRYGLVLQNKATQVKRVNNAKYYAKSRFSLLASTWSSLNDAQKNEWQFYANANPVIDKFGNEIILTGYAFFIRINQLTRPATYSNVMIDSFFLQPASLDDLFVDVLTSSYVSIKCSIVAPDDDYFIKSRVMPVSSEYTPIFRKKTSNTFAEGVSFGQATISYNVAELPYSRHKKYKCLINISHKNGWVSPDLEVYFEIP